MNWTAPYYTISEIGGGIYEIELNTSCCLTQEYLLEINVSKLFYQNKTLRITVEIDATETELISDDYPRVIGEWGKNITIEINYRTLSGLQGIPEGTISVNWTE